MNGKSRKRAQKATKVAARMAHIRAQVESMGLPPSVPLDRKDRDRLLSSKAWRSVRVDAGKDFEVRQAAAALVRSWPAK